MEQQVIYFSSRCTTTIVPYRHWRHYWCASDSYSHRRRPDWKSGGRMAGLNKSLAV